MREFEEPIKSVLSDYCHVEWWEIEELADDIRTRRRKFDVDLLKLQFERLLLDPEGGRKIINELTSNEFESRDEVVEWLRDIYEKIFP